jgi:hypothetical protein
MSLTNYTVISKPDPCRYAWWANPVAQKDRDVFIVFRSARRSQMESGDPSARGGEPALGATAALRDHAKHMPKLAAQVKPQVIDISAKAVWG